MLCFWVWFPLLYSKAAALLTWLCMFISKQQLPELCYCLGLFTEGQRTIILKVREGSKTNRLRPSWVNLEANLPRVTYNTHPDQKCQFLFSLFSDVKRFFHFKKNKLKNSVLFSWPDCPPLSYTSDDSLVFSRSSEKMISLYF